MEEKKKDERWEQGEVAGWLAVVIITSNNVVTVVSLAGKVSVNRDNESVTISSQ